MLLLLSLLEISLHLGLPILLLARVFFLSLGSLISLLLLVLFRFALCVSSLLIEQRLLRLDTRCLSLLELLLRAIVIDHFTAHLLAPEAAKSTAESSKSAKATTKPTESTNHALHLFLRLRHHAVCLLLHILHLEVALLLLLLEDAVRLFLLCFK